MKVANIDQDQPSQISELTTEFEAEKQTAKTPPSSSSSSSPPLLLSTSTSTSTASASASASATATASASATATGSTASFKTIKTMKKGYSTAVSVSSTAGAVVRKDDRRKMFEQFVNTPHEPSKKLFILNAPPKVSTAEKWKYFHIVSYYKNSPRPTDHDKNSTYACCNICGKVVMIKYIPAGSNKQVSSGGGTLSHLKSEHKLHLNNNKDVVQLSTIAELFENSSDQKFINNKDKNNAVKQATFRWVVTTNQPLNVVEETTFRAMMITAFSGYQAFDNKVLKDFLFNTAVAIRKAIVEAIENNTINLTNDHWTSKATDNYEALTAHWIDDDWVINGLPLGCFLHEGDSKSLTLLDDFFKRLFYDIGLQKVHICSMVSDTTSSMNKFGMLLEELNIDHIYCTDHIIQLTAKLAYTEKDVDTKPLMKCRDLVNFFSKSTQATEALLHVQATSDTYTSCDTPVPKKFITDVVTRWWSTYSMVERALYLRTAIDILRAERKYPSQYDLTDDDWDYLIDVKKILEPFKLAQETLEGQLYVTASFVPKFLFNIKENLESAAPPEEPEEEGSSSEEEKPRAHVLAAKMLKDFNYRWKNLDKFNDGKVERTDKNRQVGIHPAFVVASALDPRTKRLSFLFDDKERNKVWKFIETCLIQMHSGDNINIDNDDDSIDDTAFDFPLSQLNRNHYRLPESIAESIAPNSQRSDTITAVVETTDANRATNGKKDLRDMMYSDDEDDDDHEPEVNHDFNSLCKLEVASYRNEKKLKPYFEKRDHKGNIKRHYMNPLEWWKEKQSKYPLLSALARIVLAIPATSAPSERIFSVASLVITKNRTRLDPEVAGNLIFVNQTLDWFEKQQNLH